MVSDYSNINTENGYGTDFILSLNKPVLRYSHNWISLCLFPTEMTLKRCIFRISMRWQQDRAQREQECEHMKTRQTGWPSRKSWDDWVDLELNEIQIWAEPAYSQALLCSCCSVEGGCQCAALYNQCFTQVKRREEAVGEPSLSSLL